MGYYILGGTAITVVAIGVYLMYSNSKNTMRMTNAIREVDAQMNDGVITEQEMPGLARAIQSGDIHTDAYRYYRGRDT
jgi:hypothetical protein